MVTRPTPPPPAAAMMAKAQQLLLQGQTKQAEAGFRTILRLHPGFAQARRALGRIADTNPPPAESAKAKLAALEAQLVGGDARGALQQANASLKTVPAPAHLYDLIGRAAMAVEEHATAITAFNRALQADAAFFPAYVNLATALRIQAQHDAAVAAARAACDLRPDDPMALTVLGQALDLQGDVGAAEQALSKAVSGGTESLEAYETLCSLYEKTGRIDDLEGVLEKATDLAGPGALPFRRAQLAYHRKDYATVTALLTPSLIDAMPLTNRRSAMELYAKAEDQLGHADSAMEAFRAMNALPRPGYKHVPFVENAFHKRLLHLRSGIDTLPGAALSKPTDDRHDPVFLVGFPRSGTTLLDTMLRGHPDCLVLEEQAFIQDIVDAIGATPLDALTDTDIAKFRDGYFTAFETTAGEAIGSRTAIDKMPLTLVEAALVHRVFPNVRFILALRHPCDTVQSCFMQNFVPNPAMDCFRDLGDTAAIYNLSFDIWVKTQAALSFPTVTVRYEDLIADPATVVGGVFEFLRLPWHADALDHTKTAKARDRINTSSYAQVTQPIYKGAAGRWRRYEQDFEPLMPVLEPWIKHWGYGVDP